jgi:hypothetical protein
MKTFHKNRFIFLLISLPVTILLFPQEQGSVNFKQTGIQIGFSWNNLRETLISKTNHTGFGLSIGLVMEKSTSQTIQQFDFKMGLSFLKSKFETETGSYKFHVSAGYKYLFRIFDPGPNTKLYLGPYLNSDMLISYFENWDENHYYWLTNLALGPSARFENITPSGHFFRFEFSVPLISCVSRPPGRSLVTQSSSEFRDIIRTVTGHSRFSLPYEHFTMNLKAAYSIGHFRKMEPVIYWQMDYLMNNRAKSNSIINNSFTIGIETYF